MGGVRSAEVPLAGFVKIIATMTQLKPQYYLSPQKPLLAYWLLLYIENRLGSYH
jgi:hypothetical protein